LYGQAASGGKNAGAHSRETTTAGTAPRDMVGARGMGVYDQMQRVGEQDEDGHGRRRGFFASLCCRG